MEFVDFWRMFKPVRDKMNIADDAVSDFSVDDPLTKPKLKEPKPPIVISAKDPKLKIGKGVITYDGEPVTLYIMYQHQYSHHENEFKFHLADCPTLTAMRNKGTYDKYVISFGTDGIFEVVNNGIKSYKKLHVCKHCLKRQNWHNYNNLTKAQQSIIYENFSIAEFFEHVVGQAQFSRLPKYTAKNAPRNEYPPDWNKISRTMKERKNYTCENCNRHFQNEHGLHVHHKNGLRYDNRFTNLEVLCANCHQLRHPEHKILGSTNFGKNNIQGELL